MPGVAPRCFGLADSSRRVFAQHLWKRPYFNKYYPDLVRGSFVPSDVSGGTFGSTGAMEDALHDMGKRPTWVGLAFSMIYQFARAEESTGIDKNLFAANVCGSTELVGRNNGVEATNKVT